MKPLSSLLAFVAALFLFPLFSFSQAIDNIVISPANPTAEDSVRVIASVWLPSGTCWLDNHYSNTTQDTLIDIYSTFNSGMLTVICSTKDTFELGRLEPGTYHLSYIMRYVGLPAFADTAYQAFTVGTVSGTGDAPETQSYFRLLPGPDRGQVMVNYHLPTGTSPIKLSVYSTDGRLLKEITNFNGSNTTLVNLPNYHGLCLFSLETTSPLTCHLSPVTRHLSQKYLIP